MSTVAGIEVSPDHFIGGERVAGSDRFDVFSPIDESLLAQVARGGAHEAELAVAAAERAFPAWAALDPSDRAEHLRRLAGLIDENVDRLARKHAIPSFKFGGSVLFNPQKLAQWMRGPVGAA